MKAIRWGGLITFIVIAGIMAAIALFSGAVLKPVLEDKFSEMNGARVDIDAINIGYSPFSLEIKNIQIADPAQPMINTAQIDQVKFELSFGRLLMGQMVIDDASIRGIRVETPRKTSGLISKKVDEKPVEVETEEATLDIPGFDLPSVDDVLAKEPLQSDILLDKLNKDIAEIDQQWTVTRQGLPDSSKMDTYEQRFNKIKQDSKGNTAQKLAAIKDAKVLIAELKADVDTISKAKTQFSEDIKRINAGIKEVKAAPSKDIAQIKGKYSLDGAGAENVARMLFGDEVAGYLAMARQWYVRIEPYLASDEEEAKKPKAERSIGIDVKFKEVDPKPDFFIRLASVTADLPRGQFEGQLTDISSDQSVNKKPMRFKLQGVNMVGKESEALSGEFNYIDSKNSFATINYSLAKAQISELSISKSSQLPLQMKTALLTTNIKAKLQKGALKGVANNQFRQVDFETGRSSIFASAFENVDSFDIDAAFSGAIGELSIQIDSDLDNQLGKQLKQELAKKKQQFEAELKARIDEKLAAPMARIDAKKQELDAIKQRIDNAEQEMQQKIAELKKTIDSEAEAKKQEVKDDLKNKLKNKLGF